MSERACFRGCTQKDVHYATCQYHGGSYEGAFPCRGCAPRECRDGSLICDRCFGRMRGLLNDSTDLLARLESLADPRKATPSDQLRLGGTQVEAPAPVGADILDALTSVCAVVRTWEAWGRDLAAISNDLAAVSWMGEFVLDRHAPVDGVRPGWSLQDAVDQWGVERRDPAAVPFQVVEEGDGERTVVTHPEWQDPLLAREQVVIAAGVSDSTLRRWEKKELVSRVATTRGPRGTRTAWFRLSEVLAVRAKEGQNA